MKQPRPNTIRLPVREFAKKIICDGHLFITVKEGRNFYVMKPGVFVDQAFVKKHATHNTVFDFESVINEEVKQSFILILKELKYLQFEKDMRLKAVEVLRLFEGHYSREEHFLAFALACHEVFCDLPVELQARMHETDLYLFRKALYSAAFAVIMGVSNDLYHPMLLKDLFNVTMLLDVGLCEADYSYYVSEACNHENRRPGSGQPWLKEQKATDAEIKVFLSHPERGHSLLVKHKGLMAHPELAEVVLYQHELADGTGFPRAIPKGLVSSWESVVMLADTLVEIKDEYEWERSVLTHVSELKNQKLGDLPIERVYKKFCMSMDHCKKLKETGP
jgi:HD-GYP domain-containing protein (c-di-GMP phosphodiesterase class II)